MPRRILVIFNPAAGRERSRAKRLGRVVAELERRGCTVTVLSTRAPGDAERLAREADLAFDLIVAAGGDGTVNEVANGIFAASRPLAVLPLGTGNVLANEIGLPRDPRRLARVIADGTPNADLAGPRRRPPVPRDDRGWIRCRGARRARPVAEASNRQAGLYLGNPRMSGPLSPRRVRRRHRGRRVSGCLGYRHHGTPLRWAICHRARCPVGRPAATYRAVSKGGAARCFALSRRDVAGEAAPAGGRLDPHGAPRIGRRGQPRRGGTFGGGDRR